MQNFQFQEFKDEILLPFLSIPFQTPTRALWSVFLCILVAYIYIPKTVPYRFRVELFLLVGTPYPRFQELCKKYSVDNFVFFHRYLYASYMTFLQYWFQSTEEKEFPSEKIEQIKIEKAPFFIMGHYRSGTSFLHDLLNRDPNLVAPTVFQCYTPFTFLSKETEIAKKFGSVKFQRPMDGLQVGIDSAFEDEFAMANLTGLSPYLGAVFPNMYEHFQRYLTFEDVDEEEINTWKKTIMFYYKKLLYKDPSKQLIIKSPAHTARLHLFKDLFPKAKYIHISRNPYDMYKSTHRLYLHLLIQWCLQRPPIEDYHWRREAILTHFEKMYGTYLREVKTLPEDQILDVRYDDLIKDPLKVVKEIYDFLGLDSFEEVRPRIVEYQEQQKKKGFKVNTHSDLKKEDKEQVYARWRNYFDYFGYDK